VPVVGSPTLQLHLLLEVRAVEVLVGLMRLSRGLRLTTLPAEGCTWQAVGLACPASGHSWQASDQESCTKVVDRGRNGGETGTIRCVLYSFIWRSNSIGV
jgi:hypothetical protein